MSRRPTIESLCKEHKNEDVHSHFVARLSLQIFDAVYPHLRLPPSLRPVLRAAALLHDVGYCENPADHQAAGSSIVASKGLAGFTDEQGESIAAVILLHRRDYTKAYAIPRFGRLANKETVLWLGAILRIADGLDHGHLQNLSIISVKQQGGGFLLSAASPGYRANIAWAQAKADLWRRVFHKEIKIVDATGALEISKFSGIVHPKDSALGAARRLLYLHLRIVSENYQGMLSAETEEPLHDGRVAMRRFRAALRLFNQFLPSSSCRIIDEKLAFLGLALSPIRDNDVWLHFLSSQQVSEAFRGNIDFVHFHALQSRLVKTDRHTLRKLLTNPDYASLMRDINRFLRVELPQKMMKDTHPLEPHAARKLASIYFEVLSRPGMKKKYDVKEMHRLRKLCRRARYWSEFSEPALGQPASLFAKHFNALADVLGDLHDADMAIARLDPRDSGVTQHLLRIVQANKRALLARFQRAWRSQRSSPMLFAATALSHEARKDVIYCYLVRHATASADAGGNKRALGEHGIREAQTSGRALTLLQCRPDLIASSPLPRALDTAALLAQAFSFSAPVTRKHCLLPEADINGTLAWLAGVRVQTCVCVGHMPHLDQLSRTLLRPGASRPIEFARASACCISFAQRIEPGKGTLEWYFSAKKLKRIVNRITKRG
jgi:CHAD domain-containing protein/phosphohistidine phosphatase SixA